MAVRKDALIYCLNRRRWRRRRWKLGANSNERKAMFVWDIKTGTFSTPAPTPSKCTKPQASARQTNTCKTNLKQMQAKGLQTTQAVTTRSVANLQGDTVAGSHVGRGESTSRPPDHTYSPLGPIAIGGTPSAVATSRSRISLVSIASPRST